MAKVLTKAELLELVSKLEVKEGDDLFYALGHLASTVADILRVEYGTSTVNPEGFDGLGFVSYFYAAESGQACPPELAVYDPEADWEVMKDV